MKQWYNVDAYALNKPGLSLGFDACISSRPDEQTEDLRTAAEVAQNSWSFQTAVRLVCSNEHELFTAIVPVDRTEDVIIENAHAYTRPIMDDVWKAAEDMIALAEDLEAIGRPDTADRLRGIVGRIENLVAGEAADERLPRSYAEIEYDDFESAEAVEGAKWDDLNYLRYMER